MPNFIRWNIYDFLLGYVYFHWFTEAVVWSLGVSTLTGTFHVQLHLKCIYSSCLLYLKISLYIMFLETVQRQKQMFYFIFFFLLLK